MTARGLVLAAVLALAGTAGAAADGPPRAAAPTPFSTAAPGAGLPPGWHSYLLPHAKAPEFLLVKDGDATVLRVHTDVAAGTVAFDTRLDPATNPLLAWRWKVDRSIANADMMTKAGDDFAARVYVFFDVPLDSLPFRARASIRIARLVYGGPVPTAALCYVWDNKHAVGTSAWSPFSDRVRTIVLQSGDAHAGQWQEQARDVAADFRAAFGQAAPPVTGIAIGNDTDQTGATVTAWFGDFTFGPAR